MKLGYLAPPLKQQGSFTANKPKGAPVWEPLTLLRTDHCHYPHNVLNAQAMPINSLLPLPLPLPSECYFFFTLKS